MLCREIIAVCSEIHTKHINTLCGQNVEVLRVRVNRGWLDKTRSRIRLKPFTTCRPHTSGTKRFTSVAVFTSSDTDDDVVVPSAWDWLTRCPKRSSVFWVHSVKKNRASLPQEFRQKGNNIQLCKSGRRDLWPFSRLCWCCHPKRGYRFAKKYPRGEVVGHNEFFLHFILVVRGKQTVWRYMVCCSIGHKWNIQKETITNVIIW
jgi:hypothetical protein